MAVDAVLLLDLVEDRLVLGEDFAAVGDARIADQDVEIIPERLGELRLGVDEVHDAEIGRQPLGELLEARARDVALGGERPQLFDAGFEIAPRRHGSRSPASPDDRTSRTRRSILAAAAPWRTGVTWTPGGPCVAGAEILPTGTGGVKPVGLRQRQRPRRQAAAHVPSTVRHDRCSRPSCRLPWTKSSAPLGQDMVERALTADNPQVRWVPPPTGRP